MKSKDKMTIVRKAAMRSYLEQEKDKKPRAIRLTTEDSNALRSGFGSQDVAFANTAGQAQLDKTRKSSSSSKKSRPAIRPPQRSHSQHTSSPDIPRATPQRPQERVLDAAPVVIPMRTHIVLDYDAEKTPLFSSLGKGVDPFRTMFQSSYPRVSVENLKFLCARFFGTRAMGRRWIPTVLSAPHTFLSTLCVASAHYDAILERQVESVETISLRTEIIHLVSQNVVHPDARNKVDDFNLTALIQLIASEVIGRTELALDIHEKGLETMVNMRGGLSQLGVSGCLASTISWILLESAILRENRPRSVFADYCTANSTKIYPTNVAIPESPIYHPRRQFETLKTSGCCKETTLELLTEIRMMTESFLKQTKSARRNSENLLNHYRNIMRYPPISEFRETEVLGPDDYKYEAVRITAILQATAIIRRIPLSEALRYAAITVSRTASLPYTFPTASHFDEAPTSPLSPTNLCRDSISDPAMDPMYASSIAAAPPISEYLDASRSSISSMPVSWSSISSTTSYPSVSSVVTSHPSTGSISTSWPFVPLIPSRSGVPSAYSPCDNPFFEFTAAHTTDPTTDLLTDLKKVICDSNMSDCWQNMGGVLVWIGLTIGAASRKHGNNVLKKWFSALAMRASVILCFEHPEAIHATMLKMGEVIEALSAPDAMSTVGEKKRKTAKSS